jgi:hypothetical protein
MSCIDINFSETENKNVYVFFGNGLLKEYGLERVKMDSNMN